MIEMIDNAGCCAELFKALKAVQASIDGVAKDAKNQHFKSRYATLEAVIDTARPALQANGFAFTQAPGAIVDGAVEITTMLMHEAGGWMRSTLHVPLQKRDPQGVGSAITYGCRYALMATLGLPPIDDDAEAAIDRNPPSPRNPTPAKEPIDPAESESIKDFLVKSMDYCKTSFDMDQWAKENKQTVDNKLAEKDKALLRAAWTMRKHSFQEAEKEQAE